MGIIKSNRDMLIFDSDFTNQRMIVEKEKIDKYFPQFRFYGKENRVTSIQGILTTNYGNSYNVCIHINPLSYPDEIPIITLPDTVLDKDCEHINPLGDIDVMCQTFWSPVYSIALMIACTEKWLNKYELWRKNSKGHGPGNS